MSDFRPQEWTDFESEQVPCSCRSCFTPYQNMSMCRIEKHVQEHMEDVKELIKESQTTILVVGPDQIMIKCHTILLSYFSTFFDQELYGNSGTACQGILRLPDSDVEEIAAFTSWLYSGRINRFVRPSKDNPLCSCSLWILGSNLGAPNFCNSIMEFICDCYCELYFVDAPETEMVYNHTEPGSKLRLFIAELIRQEGPFSPVVAHLFGNKPDEKWMKLLRKGGDLVSDVVVSGLSNFNIDCSPWRHHKIKNYYVRDLGRCSAETWHNLKVFEGENGESHDFGMRMWW